MNRARAIQPVRDVSITSLFSTARIYMDFAAGFYVHRTPSDLTGTPTITAGLGLFVDAAGNTVSLQSTAFSSWFNAAAGTVFCEFVQLGAGGGTFGRAWNISDGTNNEFIEIAYGSPNYLGQITDGGVSQASLGRTAPAFGNIVRSALVYEANNFKMAINSTLATPDVSGTLPTVTQLWFGNRADTTRALNGYIRRFSYFPSALTDAQLLALTA